MKLLYLTDTHDMGRNPGARIDDYHTAILEKFQEAFDVAIKEKVDAVIHGGDWFHHPKVSNIIYNQHQRLLRRLKKHKIKVYVVPGNHDLYGYSMLTIDQTSLGCLAHAGLVTLLTREKSYTLDDGDVTIEIHGREYDIEIDHDPTTDYQIQENFLADVNILFAHGMLLDKPFHPDVRCTLTKDVITDADYVFTGHYHNGYPAHTIGDTTFYNIGSTSRDEASKTNLKRMPQYAIITYTSKKGWHVDIREYQCAKKGKDIFDRTQLIEKKEYEQYLEAFEQTIADTLQYDSFDPKDILTKATGIPKDIVQEALDLITEEEKKQHDSKLDGYVVKRTPISISEVEIENFQSHKKTKVVFDEKGLNAITGMSDSGKSAIIRAIRWVFYNEPRGADFIRHGASRTTVTVRFSDGSSITRSRTKTSAGEYIIRDASGQETEFKGFGNNLPIDIANTHQMPKVELAPGLERSLNFSFQLDGHFLLSESPATRAASIGRLTGVHLVDGAIKELNKEIRQITIDTNASEKRIEELNESLKAYDTLPEEEQKINAIKTFYAAAERLEQEIERLQQDVVLHYELTSQIREYKKSLEQYQGIDIGLRKISEAEIVQKEIEDLESLYREWVQENQAIVKTEKELFHYKDLPIAEQKLQSIEQLYRDTEELITLYQTYGKEHAEAQLIEQELQRYIGVSRIDDLDDLDRKEFKIQELQQLYEEYREADKACEYFEDRMAKQTLATTQIHEQIKALIQEMGNRCPTCHQPLDDHSIEGMLEYV